MSGHSHYATIKRQKALTDAARGNVFSKHSKAIMIAAKAGADPESNFKLRVAMDKARMDNMPKDNIQRAIDKATSEGGVLEEVTYEGFGPSGVSVMVEVATDNKNRTAQEVKNMFERVGGNLAGPGAVSYNFESKGFLLVKKSDDPDTQTLSIIDMGVEDITESEDGLEVYVATEKLGEIKKKLEEAGFEVTQAELQMKPNNLMELDEPAMDKVVKFLQDLEAHDDVQKVYANI
jgi:YebC/PmpR family DNA-binding regulatory protein